MKAHRTETTVSGDGSITVRGVPFEQGEAVEVIILARAPESNVARERPLKGSVQRFAAPFGPAAGADEWESART